MGQLITLLSYVGTSLTFYGHSASTGGLLSLQMDGTWHEIDLGAIDVSDGKTPVFTINGLPDGDHQLLGLTDLNAKNNTDAWVDYIECVSPNQLPLYPQGFF
jgi:hypothetical protein